MGSKSHNDKDKAGPKCLFGPASLYFSDALFYSTVCRDNSASDKSDSCGNGTDGENIPYSHAKAHIG